MSHGHGCTGQVAWSGLTDIGRHRPNNEDAFLALMYEGHEVRLLGKSGRAALNGADFVFAVSDGLGGAHSGEFASRFAADRITHLFPRIHKSSGAGNRGLLNDALLQLFCEIHGDMLRMGRSYAECAGMGATLSLCWVRADWVHFAHVGDSRIYHLPKDAAMRQVTDDHTHVGWLRRKGELNERQARSHPAKNALNQALGAGHQFIEPQIAAIQRGPGDRFLLCSDGLVDGLWDRRIEEIIRESPASAEGPTLAHRLVEEAVAASGRDNTTAIVVEFPGS